MKHFQTILLLALTIGTITIYSCKDDETAPVTPPEELLIGIWQTIELREDGITLNMDGYRVLEFREDSTATITSFESDGTEDESIEDTWALENDELISFGLSDDLDLISVTDDSLKIEYNGIDLLTGGLVRLGEDFLRQ